MAYRFRPAAARDRAAVFAFCQMTWEGGDYIPRVWDRWFADPRGALVVGVTAADQPVALGKLSVPAPGEGFIEGVRVDPAVRGQGWGRAVFAHLRDLAYARGLARVRFLTEASNTPVHRIARALGFAHVASYLPVRSASEAVASGARAASPAEVRRLWPLVEATAGATPPVRWHSWEAATATPEWLAAEAAAGHVLVTPDARGLVVVLPPERASDPEAVLLAEAAPAAVASIALLAGAPATHRELLAAARRAALTQRAAGVFGLLPPAAGAMAEAVGWTAYTRWPMWLYAHERD